MKILVLTSSFPRGKEDWWAQFVLNLYKNLPKDKFDITVLAPHAFGSKIKERIDGIKIIRFPYFYPFSLEKLTSGSGVLHASKKTILGKIQILTFVFAEFISVFLLLLQYRFDLIHVHWILPQGLAAAMAKYVFKIPFISTVHGSDVFSLQRFNMLKTFVLRQSDFCTVNSKATMETVLKLYPKTKVKLIPMGVDLTQFKRNKINKELRKEFKNKFPVILGVGRLIKWKGFDYLLKAMPAILSRFPKSALLLVGSGPEEEKLKKLAYDLGLKINENLFFMGNMPHCELSKLYSSCDVLVSPSVTLSETGEKEGQGLVILEALASGLPVVASKSGGIQDMIDGQSTGFLVKEKNPADIAEKVILILENNTYRKKFITNGLRLVQEKYSWESIAKEFSKLYNNLNLYE